MDQKIAKQFYKIAKEFLGWGGGMRGLNNFGVKVKQKRLFITKKVYHKTIKVHLINSNKNLLTMVFKTWF